MNKRRLIIGGILVGVLVILIAAGALMFGADSRARGELFSQLRIEPAAPAAGPAVSGFIEAEEVKIAPEIGGRVVSLPFREGQEVAAGDVIAVLDTTLLLAQRDALEAQLAIATAERDLLAAGVRPEIIQQAEAQVALAQAAVDAASTALQSIAAVRNNPQDILVQVAEAETQVEVAQHQVNAANAQMQIADRSLEQYVMAFDYIEQIRNTLGDETADKMWVPLDVALTPKDHEEAMITLQSAQQTLDGAQTLLGSLRALANDPQRLQGQVVNAQTSLDIARADLDRSQAQLAALQAGPRAEQLAVADARVTEAQAALDAIDVQIARYTLVAPIGAIVLERPVHEGEVAIPGVPVVTLANLDVVDLTVYLSTAQVGLVSLNQPVEVTVDSFPGRIFEGEIVNISDRAEFTPRNVQTREDRVNLVFAVRIRIENPDHALKPGMPADARFGR